MARNDGGDGPKRKPRGASVLAFVLLAMVVGGLAGFGVTNFGGSLSVIGRVGDREISVGDYANALRAEVNAFAAQVGQPVSTQQAIALGLDARARQQLVAAAALANEADRAGLSAGDARVAAELMKIPAFQGPAGAFDREAYRMVLRQNGMTEAGFEERIREDLARSLLSGAVAGGFAAPAPLVDTLFSWVAEQRGLTLLRLTPAELTAPVPAPAEADLRAHYEANVAAFTRPEARRIAWAALLPADLAPSMEVDEATLRKAYDDRLSDFVQPERRLVERLVYPDDAAAAAARARLDAGESFETLVAERGLALPDVDLGDVTEAELGPAGPAVFALAGPGVAGPLPSDLGPALFRMNAVLPAQETTFEQARPDLQAELAADAARRAIATRREKIEDALAGGATLDDLAREQGMTRGTIDLRPDSDEALAGYPAFREAAAAAAEGDDPVVVELDDGGLAALTLEAVIPAAPIPFEEARPAVAEAWTAAATAAALAARAEEIRAAIAGGAAPGSFGAPETVARIARDGSIEGAPPELLEAVFAMAPGEARVVTGPDFTAVVVLDAIHPADPASPEQAPVRAAIAAQAQQALAQDALALFTNALIAEAGVQLDEPAIAAVHSRLP